MTARLPIVGGDNNTWGTVLNTWLSQMPMFNVIGYNAVVDGATDDTTALQNAINAANTAGGGYVFIPGISAISAPLTLSAGVLLIGAGLNTGIKMLSGFSGAQALLCNANNTGVLNMQISGNSTTYSSNPSATGIQITGAVSVRLANLLIQYINGWCIQSTATSGQANYNLHLENIHGYSSKQGYHDLGVSGSSNGGSHSLFYCNMDQMQNGDCYLFEDVDDIIGSHIFGSCTAGSGNSVHVKGLCTTVHLSNVDLGPFPGPSTGAVVLVESGTNGSPSQVSLRGGVVVGGSTNIAVSAGNRIECINLQINNSGTYGVNITGGDVLLFDGCQFDSNGSAGSSGRYDFQSSTTGHVKVHACDFRTPQGTTANHTNNVLNCTSWYVFVEECAFYGTGYNSGNIINSYPYYIRNCFGYNPLGNISVTVPASTVNFATLSGDSTYFIKGGTLTDIKVGGVSTGISSAAPSGAVHSVRVPAQQTLSITYSAAPTVTVFSD